MSNNTIMPYGGAVGPEVANSTNFTLTHTLDCVLVVNAGLYFCKALCWNVFLCSKGPLLICIICVYIYCS